MLVQSTVLSLNSISIRQLLVFSYLHFVLKIFLFFFLLFSSFNLLSFIFLELGQGTSEGKALFHCNYCNKDITGKIRIKCCTCADFDLCIECFSVGAEVTPHKSNHPYSVMVSNIYKVNPLHFDAKFMTNSFLWLAFRTSIRYSTTTCLKSYPYGERISRK